MDPVTRTIISDCPDGSRVVLHQRILPNGDWHNSSAEASNPMSTPTTSGSQHDHAKCSASGSKSWLQCTAAIAYCEQHADRIFEQDVQSVIKLTPYLKNLPPEELFPHEGRAMRWARDVREGRVKPANLTPEQKKDIQRAEGNEYSREGTRAHEFATQIFAGEKTIDQIPEEFREPVGYYVKKCLGLLESPDEPYFPETRIPYFYDRESHGTVDFRIIRDDRVIIADLKYGAGDLVDAAENTQCAIYGLSVVDDLEASGMYSFEPDTIIEIWIIQPRHHADLPAKKWEVTLADLRAFCEPIREKHDLIAETFGQIDNVALEDLGLTFAPSESACKYCKAKNFCPVRAEAATAELAGPDYSGIDLLADLPDIEEIEGTTTKKEFNSRPPEEKVNLRLGERGPIPTEDLVKVFLNAPAILEWIKDVKEYVGDLVLSGTLKSEHLKIVMGNPGDREWVDEEAAAKMLGNRLKESEKWTKKLLSPAKAEKLLDLKKEGTRFKNLFAAAITRPAGRPVVVDVGDKRDAIAALSDDLEDIVDEEEIEWPEGM